MSVIDGVLTAVVNTVKDAVPILNAYDKVLVQITAPAIIAFSPDRVPYDETFDGDTTMWFVLRLLVTRTQDGSDQAQLNAFISPRGVNSVVGALKASPNLGGAVDDLQVIEAVNYGNWPHGGKTYLGVELRVKAMLSGD